MQYQIVQSESLEDLSSRVNALLAQDWIPAGGAFTFHEDTGDPVTFAQTLLAYGSSDQKHFQKASGSSPL